MSCSSHPEPSVIQPFGDPLGQGRWVGTVIAYCFYACMVKEGVKILQSLMFSDRALFSRGSSFYTNLQAGPQQHEVEGHLFQDLACGVDEGWRY